MVVVKCFIALLRELLSIVQVQWHRNVLSQTLSTFGKTFIKEEYLGGGRKTRNRMGKDLALRYDDWAGI